MKLKLPERRRFVRLEVPLVVAAQRPGGVEEMVTKNISPVGFMVEVKDKFEESGETSFEVSLPGDGEPVSVKGRVIWQNKISLEDGAPYEVGIEIIHIEDRSKNEFLKYLCDLLYESEYRERS